jgi:hypothetical protein
MVRSRRSGRAHQLKRLQRAYYSGGDFDPRVLNTAPPPSVQTEPSVEAPVVGNREKSSAVIKERQLPKITKIEACTQHIRIILRELSAGQIKSKNG